MTAGLLSAIAWPSVSWTLLAPFALTCILIELTPGPNMAYLAVLSLSRGHRAGLAAVAGVALGLALVGIGAALGLSALIASSPTAYQALRWGGVIFLLWLAWDTWRDGRSASSAEIDGDGADRTYFMRGLATNLLNPKAALFFVAVLPAYLDPARSLLGQSILLSLVYVLIASAIHGAIVMLASSARPMLERAESSATVRRIFALMLVAVAAWFAVSTAK